MRRIIQVSSLLAHGDKIVAVQPNPRTRSVGRNPWCNCIIVSWRSPVPWRKHNVIECQLFAAMHDIRFWHKADMPVVISDVRFGGKADIPSTSLDVSY
jgi:hypothetical protein